MIKAIIFDFDGVIVESVDIKTKAFVKMFQPYGKEIADSVVDYHMKNGGISRFEKIKYYYKNFLNEHLSEDKLNQLANEFSDIVLDEVIKSPYVEGAESFLNTYYKIYTFYIVSGTPEDELKKIVRARGLEKYFKYCFGSPTEKTVLVQNILNTEKLACSEIVFVGDATTDYFAAKENNIFFIGRVPEGYNNPFPLDIPIIKDIKSLPKYINQNNI